MQLPLDNLALTLHPVLILRTGHLGGDGDATLLRELLRFLQSDRRSIDGRYAVTMFGQPGGVTPLPFGNTQGVADR